MNVPELGPKEENPSEDDYSSDSTNDSTNDERSDREEGEGDALLISPGLDYSCTNKVKKLEQDNDDAIISRVRDWVGREERPPPSELEAEGQEVRQLACRRTELDVLDGILMHMRQGKTVLPHNLRQVVFRHMHASPLSAGHMGRDRTYRHLREKACWPCYRPDIYEWMRRRLACQLAKPGPGRGRMPLIRERACAPFVLVALDLMVLCPHPKEERSTCS
jgi:hypothetical protein